MALTISWLWVAMSTVVPSWLIWIRSWMISQLVTGSRLPVGSSAMSRAGSWTRARAIAMRCCSPPESWRRQVVGRGPWRPDQVQQLRHTVVGSAWRAPVTSSAKATFSQTVLARQQPEVLEDDADLAPQLRHVSRAACGQVAPGDRHPPLVGSCSRMRSRMNVLFPAPGRPDEEDEVAARDADVTSASATLPFG